MHGAGALEGVEEDAALGLSCHGRVEQIDGDQGEHDAGQDQAGGLALALAAAQGETHAEEDRAQTDADHQAGQTEQGIGVAAGQAHDDAPGAAQEDQGTDGRDDAQQEADGRGGAAAGAVFAEAEGGGQGAQHHAHDLGAQVLDDGRAVQAHSPRDVAVEADHADAHVAGVAGELQKDGYQAQEKARDHDARGGREEIEAVFHATPQRRDAAKVERCAQIRDGPRGWGTGIWRRSRNQDMPSARPPRCAPHREAGGAASGMVHGHGRFSLGQTGRDG